MTIPEEIARLEALQTQADLDQLGRAQTGGPMTDSIDLEAIKKNVYQLQTYCFEGAGGSRLNYLINLDAPALIAEVERLREIVRENATLAQAGDTSESRP